MFSNALMVVGVDGDQVRDAGGDADEASSSLSEGARNSGPFIAIEILHSDGPA